MDLYTFKCEVCADVCPSIHQHIHHKVPKSLGGTDDPSNLANLCPQCHNLLHNIAYKLVSKKVSITMLEDMAAIVYEQDLTKVKKCLELAMLVRDEIIKSKEVDKDPNEYTEITIKLKLKHKKLIHDWAKQCNLSLERFVRSILLKSISDKYSITIDLHKEEESLKNYKKYGN